MAGSARFGGQIDASGILGDIYESELRNREALAGQGARRAQEEQSALDRDAQSRWQSGEMSDEDWLDYARGRVRASRQFPEEQAEWEKVLRESSDMISVNQAESAYQQGGSINQLIAFYQMRAKDKSGNSAGGREATERLNQLVDQRLSEEVTRNVEDIQDQIDAGHAKPADLLAYLRGARGQARSNSDLARSLEGDIEQVDDQIAAMGREFQIADLQHKWQTGAISGDEYAAGMKAAAAQYANTNPSTYFSMLAEASTGERYGRYSFDGASGGGGGGGGGRGGRGGGPLSLSGLAGEWEDKRWRASDILSQVMAGDTTVTDPGTGDKIDVTTSAGRRWLENVNRDAFSTFAAERRVGMEIGDREMSQRATAGHDEFLLTLTQPSNTMLERESAGYLIQNIQNEMASMETETDPLVAQRTILRLADRVDQFIAGRTGPRMNQRRADSADGAITGANSEARGPEAQVDPGFIGELAMLSGALRTGEFDDRLNVTSGVGDLLDADQMNKFTHDASVTHDKATGMGTRWTYAVIPGRGVEIVPLATATRQVADPNTGAVSIIQVPVPQPEALASLGIDENYNQVAVAVQVGDAVIRMNGYSTMQATPWKHWVAAESFNTVEGVKVEKGLAIDNGITLTPAEKADLIESGAMVQIPYVVETFQAPDAQGKLHTFTRIPGNSWVKGAYPMNPTMNADGTVVLDSNGSISGTARITESVLVPFLGTDPKLAQQAIDRGEFDDIRAETYAVDWKNLDALPTAFDASGTFWNPEDAARRARVDAQAREFNSNISERAGMADWWDNKSRGQRAADRWHADVRANRDAAKQRSEGDMARNAMATNPMRDLFSNEGAGMGVSFGGARVNSNPNDPNKVEARSPSSWPSEQMPKVNLPRIGGPPSQVRPGIDFLPSRLPSPQASSGPFIARSTSTMSPRPQPAVSTPSFLARMITMGGRVTGKTPTADNKTQGTTGGARPT